MYFVIFANSLQKHLIVPDRWIQDNNFEKHVHHGLNTNQLYRCFYTSKAEAFDGNGEPKREYPVNHRLDLITADVAPQGDFNVLCQLRRFFCK